MTETMPALGWGSWVVRLVPVEVRKLVDTRASRWVLGSMAVFAVAVAGLLADALGQGERLTLVTLVGGLNLPIAVAMAVVGILGMTGDWAHRVTSSYFPMVPSRSAVFVAKLLATALVSVGLLGAMIVAFLVVLGIVGVSSDRPVGLGAWPQACVLALLITGFGTWFGLAVASVVRRFALALVVVVVLQVGVNLVLLSRLPEVMQAAFSTLTPLAVMLPVVSPQEVPPDEMVTWWQAATSLLTWYIAPLVLGWWIAERSEA